MFVPQNLHHFHFLLSMFQIFKTQLLCLATGHSSHFLWRNFNFGALWTIAHLAIEVDLGHNGDVLFCILRLHWNWTGQCFALDRTLDSILHRSGLGRRAKFSQKERYFVGSRGRNWDQIEITLQQSRKKQENNRWRKKVIILGAPIVRNGKKDHFCLNCLSFECYSNNTAVSDIESVLRLLWWGENWCWWQKLYILNFLSSF